jgi:hypothetical protein
MEGNSDDGLKIGGPAREPASQKMVLTRKDRKHKPAGTATARVALSFCAGRVQ